MYVSPVHIATSTSIVNLLLTFNLKSHTSRYLPDSGSYLTLDPLLFDLCKLGNHFHSTFDSATSLWSLGSTYTCIQHEIPGLQQKAGAVHKLKPLSRSPSYLEL